MGLGVQICFLLNKYLCRDANGFFLCATAVIAGTGKHRVIKAQVYGRRIARVARYAVCFAVVYIVVYFVAYIVPYDKGNF